MMQNKTKLSCVASGMPVGTPFKNTFSEGQLTLNKYTHIFKNSSDTSGYTAKEMYVYFY